MILPALIPSRRWREGFGPRGCRLSCSTCCCTLSVSSCPPRVYSTPRWNCLYFYDADFAWKIGRDLCFIQRDYNISCGLLSCMFQCSSNFTFPIKNIKRLFSGGCKKKLFPISVQYQPFKLQGEDLFLLYVYILPLIFQSWKAYFLLYA